MNDHGETGKIVVTVKNRDELKWIIPLAVVSLLVFANSLGGDFVYDDNRQILRNTLIPDYAIEEISEGMVVKPQRVE